jgi:UDP-4-amino-4,6-dideoxy-N-acetyl-beta-L-altrosamine N-acetyltransferase
MKFEKYGITLRRITSDDLELLRTWRNAEAIQQHMNFRQYITKQMQKKWFRSIDNFCNFYYIIEYNNEMIGLFNEKNIDWKNRTSETGLFIADQRYIDTQIPILASLCLSEIGFYIVQGEKSFIRILKENHRAIDYSLSFGYQLCEGQQNIRHQLYVLTKENFEIKGAKLLKSANKVYKEKATLLLFLEKHDYKSGLAQFLENLIDSSPIPVPYIIIDGCRHYHYP